MRSPLLAVLLASVLSGAGPAQQAADETAADVTEPGRDIARCLDIVLGSVTENPAGRNLLLAVDPSPSLAQAGFADELERALARQKDKLGTTRLALAAVAGKKRGLLVAPTADHAAVVAALRGLLAASGNEIENVFAEVRTLTTAAAAWTGAREFLIVTLENGDAEDDVDGTADRLRRAGVRATVLTSEACLADSYWAARPYEQPPRGAQLAGGDAPFIDVPWGFLLQVNVANEVTPSGFGPWSLTRLAAATHGRVFLFAPPRPAAHKCWVYDGCLFCNGDHFQPLENYLDGPLRPLAPSSKSRTEACRDLGSDQAARAVLRAWSEAAKAGLLRSQPPLQLAGTSAAPATAHGMANLLSLFDWPQFERNAKRAEKGAEECARIGAALEKDIERLEHVKVLPRQRAIAELLRLDLQLLKVNLLLYAAWCREIAPARLAKDQAPPEPPEVAEVPAGIRPVGIYFTNHCLCHGVEPFLAVELPGGDTVRGELQALDVLARKFREHWAQTPFVVALHRSGIASFHFTVPGTAVPPPRIRPKSRSDQDPVTTGQPRQPRAPATGGAGPTGPTTGGK